MAIGVYFPVSLTKGNKMKKIICLLLALILVAGAIPMMASCSPPPALADVKDRLVYLIKGAEAVNDIFFGEGLVSDNDVGLEFDGEHYEGLFGEDEYNSALEGQDIYIYYTRVPESYTTKDGIKKTQFTSVAEIKAEAEKYYSKDYLRKIYPSIFVDDYYGENGLNTRAKYLELEVYDMFGNAKEKLALHEYAYHSPIITKENPATVYDLESMKIVTPSSATLLLVEIQGYGTYFDPDKGEKVTGWHSVLLQFALQDGEWYLDGPSY